MSFMELSQYARLVFAGMLLFIIAYQLWVARARPSEPVLYLVAAWAGAALVVVVGRSIQHATSDPATVLLGSRVYHTGVLSLVPLGFALTHETRLVPRDRSFWGAVAISSVPIPLVWASRLIVSDQVRVFQTLTGPILGPEPAGMGPLALPYLAAIAAYLYSVARRGRRDLPRHQRLAFGITFFGVVPVLINDILLYAGTIVSVELVGFALFLHIMSINVGIFTRAGELFASLEKTVEERTVDLARRETELSQQLAARRRILDAIPDAICLLHQGRFDYVNEGGVEFFGRARSDLVGSRFLDHVAADLVDSAEACLAAMAAAQKPTQPVDLRFGADPEAQRSAEVAGLMLDLGEERRMLVTVRDVTERQQLLARLQVADRLASVGTLAAGVAHEINNPLTFVGGNLDLIRDALDRGSRPGEAGGEALPALVEDCRVGTQRIARIVKDLLAFTRADDERVSVEVRSILEFALKIATVTIRHRAEVRVDYGPAPTVLGDSRRLSQVFLNLLVNAFQSIPDDGGEHLIRVSVGTRADGWAVVEIADTGRGIDPELRPRVFDPFVTTKAPGQGTGLGLFICHGILAELGGEIRLLPGDPVGTVARVALPPAPAAVSPRRATARDDQAGRDRRPRKVLVVDDEELVRQVLERMLEHHQVTAVGSGEEAIQAMEARAYDVILCDLAMPVCSGVDVWEAAKRLGCEDRFVLMTGGATTDALREFVERSQVPCITKPLEIEEIEAAFDGRSPGTESPTG